MKTFLNALWLIFGGLADFVIYLVIGVMLCLTVIGIPFGIQMIKIALLAVWPFGIHVEGNFEAHPYLNLIWISLFGLLIAVTHFITGLLLCLTLIGIPFGIQNFKIAKYAFDPFGADYYPAS
jgi:uncharacterized membrane protein YccF (DUF307 family)